MNEMIDVSPGLWVWRVEHPDWDPDAYLDLMLADIPAYLDLQEQVAEATRGLDVENVLELGVGTAETARRVLELTGRRVGRMVGAGPGRRGP